MNFKELEKIYNEVAVLPPQCSSVHKVTRDDSGVYRLYCAECGILGFMDAQAAIRLGYLPDE